VDYLSDYNETKLWFRKVIVMGLLHNSKKLQSKWSVKDTADFFNVSIGLVSENLRLASHIDTCPEIIELESRQKALDFIERRKVKRISIEDLD
jgi:hypothetical protein